MSALHSHLTPDGKTTAAFLDWRDASHYSPYPRSCGSCGQSTLLRNDSGDPQHKSCAEHELEQSQGGDR